MITKESEEKLITIKTVKKDKYDIKEVKKDKYDGVEMHITKYTPYINILLGCEMLIEALLKEVPNQTIDDILADLKIIYERDNKKSEL